MTDARASVFDTLMAERRSTRAFLPDPVREADVRAILETARRAPSGGNLQPWRVIAVAGAERDAVVRLAARRLAESPLGEPTDRPIYPPKLGEPYRSRRRECAEAMYERLGVPREDKAARLAWLARNFDFFGAPAALFFIIDEDMGHGQWSHLGMFEMACALKAQTLGFGVCFQESWAMLRPSLAAHFGLDEGAMVACAMAFGRTDERAPVNALRTGREAVDAFAQLRGFQP